MRKNLNKWLLETILEKGHEALIWNVTARNVHRLAALCGSFKDKTLDKILAPAPYHVLV